MGRVDIRDLSDETMEKIDKQMEKYNLKNRSDYIRLLIELDVLTNIVEIIRERGKKK